MNSKKQWRIPVKVLLLAGIAAFATPAMAQSIENAVSGAKTDGLSGASALDAYFDAGDGLPATVVRQATNLIDRLSQDRRLQRNPVGLQDALDRVERAVTRALNSRRIIKVEVADNFRLTDQRRGWDFGAASASAYGNFEAVDEADARIAGQAVGGQGGAQDDLFGDGLNQVRKFTVGGLPNGVYRLVVMTDQHGVPDAVRHRFGASLRVNGRTHRVAQTPPGQWPEMAYLTKGGVHMDDGDLPPDMQVIPGSGGGVIVTNANVSASQLQVEIIPSGNAGTFITGLFVEPEEEDSVLLCPAGMAHLCDPNDAQIAEAEAQVAEKVGEELTKIPPAGPLSPLPEIITGPPPFKDDPPPVASPN